MACPALKSIPNTKQAQSSVMTILPDIFRCCSIEAWRTSEGLFLKQSFSSIIVVVIQTTIFRFFLKTLQISYIIQASHTFFSVLFFGFLISYTFWDLVIMINLLWIRKIDWLSAWLGQIVDFKKWYIFEYFPINFYIEKWHPSLGYTYDYDYLWLP